MQRHAFTLVELLVSITIIVILTALVLAAFSQNDADRLSAAARLVQSHIEGAKSRAISDQKVRGVRLISDDNDPFIANSIVYIGANDFVAGSLIDIRQNIGDDTTPNDDFWEIENSAGGVWNRLLLRDLIRIGCRIEIPQGSGMWVTLSDDNFDPVNDVVSITGQFHTSSWQTDTTITQAGRYVTNYPRNAAGALDPAIPYRLEVAPSILPNQSPTSFPRGIAIDLAASRIQAGWAPGDPVEIMFNATGQPDGYLGLVNLYVTTLSDIELTRGMFPTHPANGGTLAPPIVPANPPTTPKEEPVVLTVFGQTGLSTTAPVDLTDSDGDLMADDPFSHARRGRESQ